MNAQTILYNIYSRMENQKRVAEKQNDWKKAYKLSIGLQILLRAKYSLLDGKMHKRLHYKNGSRVLQFYKRQASGEISL